MKFLSSSVVLSLLVSVTLLQSTLADPNVQQHAGLQGPSVAAVPKPHHTIPAVPHHPKHSAAPVIPTPAPKQPLQPRAAPAPVEPKPVEPKPVHPKPVHTKPAHPKHPAHTPVHPTPAPKQPLQP
ncbi:hypothetical protein BGZ58_004506, partial [Dissophora ornata]